MSGADGWPAYTVDAEHLPDRRLRLWLRQGEERIPLGSAVGTTGLHLLVRDRVAERLDLVDHDST